jgi:hypothetical protein
MYKDFCERNQLDVDKYYLNSTYKDAIKLYGTMRNTQLNTSLILVESEMTNLLAGRDTSELSTSEMESYHSLESMKSEFEKKLNDPIENTSAGKTKIDTIIDESRQLMGINLSEIALTEARIEKMDGAAAELINAYENIIQGNVSTHRLTDTVDILKGIPADSAYGSHPNQVPAPEAPKDVESALTNKKETNQQDAIALQNTVSYTLYKQECLYRDITAMKVNVMAFILAIETLEQYKTDVQAIGNSALYARYADKVKKK